MLAEGTLLNNRYRILRVLSDQGGMGVVYQAADQNFSDDTVVIKQSRFATESLYKAFEREARLLYKLRQDALPRVIDYFPLENVGQFFVMDFIPGKDLADLLEDRLEKGEGPFPVDQVLRWADLLLDVLHYLHTQETPIIHRDIKPQNLKLRPDGRLFLLDFGLAKGATAGMSVAGSSVRGYTPHYAPLEQIRGKGTDARSDLYSLAVTLSHLLTGELPADAVARVTDTISGDPDPLRPAHELNSQVPQAVSEVLQQAASLNQNDRPKTAIALRQALQQAARITDRQRDQLPKVQPLPSTLIDKPQPAPAPLPQPPPQKYPEPVFPDVLPQPRPAIPQSEPVRPSPAPVNQASGNGWKVTAAGIVLTTIIGIGAAVNYNFSTSPNVLPSPVPVSSVPASSPTSSALQSFTQDLDKGIKLEMVSLSGGTFTMGSNDYDGEKPPHQVTVSPFSIGKYEVTQAQYQAVMGKNPSNFKGNNLPVEQVSWNDAVGFCKKLSNKSGKTYRLPTEAEWEYACRAGSEGNYAGTLDEMAWYGNNSGKESLDAYDLYFNVFKKDFSKYSKRLQDNGCQTHPVGQKKPNAFGLFDLHGNVWEWCQDWYDKNYYQQSLGNDPQGPSSGTYRVLRGGSWVDLNVNCRSAFRGIHVPDARIFDVGVRVVAGERTQ